MSESVATMAQNVIMVEFMERYGDLSEFQEGNIKDELDNLQKWVELTNVLNDKRNGDPKPLDGWKKSWEILKTNAQNKFQGTVKKRGTQPIPTEIDIRIMAVMQIYGGGINRKRKLTESSGQEDHDEEVNNEEQNITEEDESSEQVKDEKDHQLKANEEQDNNKRLVMVRPNYYWALKNAMIPYMNSSLAEANFDVSTRDASSYSHSKRKRHDSDDLVDLAERYLEFEKKKAVMEHGRELLRIHQSERQFGIMGRITKTMEVASSALTKCIDGLLNLGSAQIE